MTGATARTASGAYDRERSPGYLVSLANRLFAAVLRERLATFGVTPAQVPIILWLRERDGLTQKELGERASIEQPSAAEMLNRMERAALVTRTRDPDDGRRWRYHLSERARGLAEELAADASFGNEVALDGFTEAEIENLLAQLQRVIDNLRRFPAAQARRGTPSEAA